MASKPALQVHAGASPYNGELAPKYYSSTSLRVMASSINAARPLSGPFKPTIAISSSSATTPSRLVMRIPGHGIGRFTSTPSPARLRADDEQHVTRSDFPPDFLFGVGTSAFQVEGAPFADGRGNTIWDSFVHTPGRIADGVLNYPGCKFYDLFEEDIKIVKSLGFQVFRFSISWSRIYPDGTGQESSEGISFYNKLINAIIRHGLTPLVTLFHWETPQYLENDPNVLGWRTKNIIPYFEKLAELCFIHYGDRVKMWATVNEMFTYTSFGFSTGNYAPGRCTPSLANNPNCTAGDSRTEPYLVGHHLLLGHAKVYQLYKQKYKDQQGGICGFNPVHFGAAPYSDSSEEDKQAVERFLLFLTGWQCDPLIFGDYPKLLRDMLGERLPRFTEEESTALKNSFDFLGNNYYSAFYIKHQDLPEDPSQRWFGNDGGYTTNVTNAQGELIGPLMGPSDSWLHNCAPYLPKVLEWMKERYGNIPCFITENGSMDPEPNDEKASLKDDQRITYIKDHLWNISKVAIKEKGIDVRGYIAWSYMDNFEWQAGFTDRFGLVRVRFEDVEHPTRILKDSAKWFKAFLLQDT